MSKVQSPAHFAGRMALKIGEGGVVPGVKLDERQSKAFYDFIHSEITELWAGIVGLNLSAPKVEKIIKDQLLDFDFESLVSRAIDRELDKRIQAYVKGQIRQTFKEISERVQSETQFHKKLRGQFIRRVLGLLSEKGGANGR